MTNSGHWMNSYYLHKYLALHYRSTSESKVMSFLLVSFRMDYTVSDLNKNGVKKKMFTLTLTMKFKDRDCYVMLVPILQIRPNTLFKEAHRYTCTPHI